MVFTAVYGIVIGLMLTGLLVMIRIAHEDNMKLNKEVFLKSELGSNLRDCVISWDKALDGCRKYQHSEKEYRRERKVENWCQAQWEVYQMVLRQFYGAEYHFTRSDGHVGVVAADEGDWLFRMEKGEEGYE